MTKLNITIPTGENIEVELVRYFDQNTKKYLVYTLNEKDEQGFVKLYVTRVGANGGEFIDDDTEWKTVKDEFKKIIGENSDSGKTTANDLNPIELNNFNVKGHRIIKLMESYVNLLSANQKQFEAPKPSVETQSQVEIPTMDNVNNNEAPNANLWEPPTVNTSMPNTGAQTAFTPWDQPTKNEATPTYNAPTMPYPSVEEPKFEQPVPIMSTSNGNYEEMYKDLKEKYDRMNSELEKVTNENVELRIKLDDIREILNEN